MSRPLCLTARSAVLTPFRGGAQADKVKIVTNLLTVTCSDDNASPVINV